MGETCSKQVKLYEIFIRKTFQDQKVKSYQTGIKLIHELCKELFDDNSSRQRVPVERKLFKLKLNIQKVLIKLKKKKEYKNSHDQFTFFIVLLQDANTLEEVSKIITRTMAKIIEIENEMKGRKA